MRLHRYIVALASVLLLALVALADGWVHSTDGRTVDRVAQPLPRLGINLTTGQGENMRDCDPGLNAMCGWYRVIPAAPPPAAMVITSRTWVLSTNLTAREVLTWTNKPDWQL